MKGINGVLRFDDQAYATAQALPTATTADGNGGSLEVSQTQNSINVYVRVNEEITVVDTKTLTVDLYDSADNSTFAKKETIYTVTASGGDSVLEVDAELADYVVPYDTKRYTKIVITTDNATAGKIDIFPRYIAR